MVSNNTTGKDIYGALAYNQHKVDRGKGAVLATSNIREPDDGRFGVAALADELLRWMPSHVRTEKPVVHISLNPDPEDRLSDDENAGAGAVKTYFKIENAVDGNGEPANLAYIDFVKVQTGVNAKAGWLGENSTEVFGFTDENLNQGK